MYFNLLYFMCKSEAILDVRFVNRKCRLLYTGLKEST